MTVSILVLLAGVVVLSAATRKPCLQVCTGAWHTWKAGHMTRPEAQEACKLRVSAEAQTPQVVPEVAMLPPPSIYVPLDQTIPPAISIVVQLRHFRAPPPLG
ncbi:MAG: hypothetical protein ABSG32_05915 [Terriglobia bacterium]|jgi:hypothetical protein